MLVELGATAGAFVSINVFLLTPEPDKRHALLVMLSAQL
jgi:hypothetical protein